MFRYSTLERAAAYPQESGRNSVTLCECSCNVLFTPLSLADIPLSLTGLSRGGHGRVEEHRSARRPRAQSEEHRRGHSARSAGGHHRPFGFGQVIAGLRHDLCRGTAALCRKPVGLCAPVPRHDGEAGRGPYQRSVPGDFDRAEDHQQEPAFDGRHGDRDLRLPPLVVRPRRNPLQPGDRSAHRGAAGAGHGRPRHGDGGGNTRLSVGAHRARPERRISQGILRTS